MSKTKRLLSMLLVVALVAGIAISGTLAYLTSTDGDVNVMTLGNVQIEQHELQRVDGVKHNATAVDGSLEEFEQNQALYPAVPVNGAATDYSAEQTDLFKWGPYVTAEGAGNGLWNDEKLHGAMDKMVFVENTGKSACYYRTILAFECPEGMAYSQGADKEFMMNVNGHSNFIWEQNGYHIINGTRYLVMTATYKEILGVGETSRPSLLQVVMTHNATNEDMLLLGDTYEILALSQAVQTAGFADAKTALDTAFGDVAENAGEWLKNLANESSTLGPDMTPDARAEYNGTIYDTIYEAVAAANENGGGTIKLMGTSEIDRSLEIASNITIEGENKLLSRKEGFTGTMITVKTGSTLTVNSLWLDGKGATATGNLIATEGNGSIVLNEGTVLQNNNGAHAVSLATRGGGTLTLNGAHIVNNSSDSGAIWGGGHITVNEGSKINNNSSTGSAGAIRMVGSCNFTMNGGEMCNNTAASDGGAIWGYGTTIYNFNGGVIANNTASGTGGFLYTGTYSVINISGDIEIRDNSAANSGAIRLTDHTSMNMTGGKIYNNKQNGESNAFNTWNNSITLSGGEISDNFSFVGGLGLTIGKADISGVINYDLSTNHNTAYLEKEFNGFKFKVNESDEHFANFNFKPADGYTYTEGDEAKLVCMNEGYSTYWDAATGTFRLKAE